MSNPIEEQFQQIVGEAEAEAREAAYSVNFISIEVPREDEAPLRASYPDRDDDPFPQTSDNDDHQPLLMNTGQGRELLRMVLMAEHARNTESPISLVSEVDQNKTEPATSPTLTEQFHPGYPYREHTDGDIDLSKRMAQRPYLAAQTNKVTGDP